MELNDNFMVVEEESCRQRLCQEGSKNESGHNEVVG